MGEGSKFFEQGVDSGDIKEGSGNTPEDIERLAKYFGKAENKPSQEVLLKMEDLRRSGKYGKFSEDALREYATALVNAEGEKSLELGDPTVIGENADKKRKWKTKIH